MRIIIFRAEKRVILPETTKKSRSTSLTLSANSTMSPRWRWKSVPLFPWVPHFPRKPWMISGYFAKRCIIIPTTSWQLPEGFWGTCVTQFYTAAYGFQIAKYREKLLQLRDSHTTPSNVVQNLRISFRSLKQITDYTYRHLDVAFFCDCCVQITSLQGFGG